LRQTSSHRVAERAFTFIELLVILIIVAIAFFAIRPSFTRVIESAQERAGVRRLVGLLAGSRTEALGRGQLLRVVCDVEAGLFWAEAQVDPQVDRSEFEVIPILGREHMRLPDHLAIIDFEVAGQSLADLGYSEIYFYPDGRTDGAYLSLLNDTGREFIIELASATGRVTVDAHDA
jgi:Tfp pilus assembly protein FimT